MNKTFLKNNLANIITCTRIAGTAAMLFTTVFSRGFFIAYTYAGITDIADGFVARKLKISSRLGAKLDSISDILFFVVMMVKVLPRLRILLPKFLWRIIIVVLLARLFLYSYVGITRHEFLSNHTILNKATGFTIFFVPYFVETSFFVAYSFVVIAISVAACIYELKLVFIDDM